MLPLPYRFENRNVLEVPKMQSCFSAVVLHLAKVPWSSSNSDFVLCYHDIINSNVTSNRNRYSLPDGSLGEVFQEVEGEGLPWMIFTGIFTGRKVSILRKHGFLIRKYSPGPLVLSCLVFITLVTFLRLDSTQG